MARPTKIHVLLENLPPFGYPCVVACTTNLFTHVDLLCKTSQKHLPFSYRTTWLCAYQLTCRILLSPNFV